uniref:Uncharacterized protein n=1 Tax=Anguilla anguilla TaxID=7936 RepID=A0A0E9UZL6_ANGAN
MGALHSACCNVAFSKMDVFIAVQQALHKPSFSPQSPQLGFSPVCHCMLVSSLILKI